MIKALLLASMLLMVGCASTGPSLRYLDLTPTMVLGVVSSNDESAFGLSVKVQHLYEIDHEGKATLRWSGQANAPGPVQSLIQSGVGASGAAQAAVMTPVVGALLPSTTVKATK